ncbi:hypothetical protein [Kaistia terrae]|uniref:ParB/Sulfiredoxin domain-containing protein n=1 Tax=Kaistia terrae TaxID=537017 RepID=A0ABW0PX31_9HYPH|nr:hypothetical protein [Kaistia terrae]MCX5581038.1 hypothetical protein [Kaistia terrae]
MAFRSLPLSLLIVNKANDRHGELENETAAIGWLFSNRELHMRNLAKDIVAEGGIYDAPLVTPNGEEYLVFDGNRRVTCMKLIARPNRSPTIELQRFFIELREQWEGEFPSRITCQVESNRDRIDDILYRRHTGTQNGVGQSTWDDRMKSNFVERTGKSSGLHIADEVEKRLVGASLWDSKRKIPRSNMNRLLSSEAYRNRVGFSISRGNFEFTHNETASLKALFKIADDLTSKSVVLNDIWDVSAKRQYLDRLDREGVLPTAADVLTPPSMPPSKPLAISQPKPFSAPKTQPRITLIPNDVEYPLTWSGEQQRLKAIWDELACNLELSKHPNAIAVMFRVLVELAVDSYIRSMNLSEVHENDKLSNRVLKVAADMNARKKIDKRYYDECKKLNNSDQLLSMATMNSWVHSPRFNPSPQHMISMWGSLSTFIVECINA